MNMRKHKYNILFSIHAVYSSMYVCTYLFEGGVGQHALPHLSYTESGDAQGLYV